MVFECHKTISAGRREEKRRTVRAALKAPIAADHLTPLRGSSSTATCASASFSGAGMRGPLWSSSRYEKSFSSTKGAASFYGPLRRTPPRRLFDGNFASLRALKTSRKTRPTESLSKDRHPVLPRGALATHAEEEVRERAIN